MSRVQKCVFDLSADQVAFIDDQVASGAFASTSDVVGQTYDAMLADPSRAVPAQAVFDEIRARHAASHTR